jgi:beta-1,4-mannosyltransferase
MNVFAAPAFSNEKVNPYNALLYRELQQLDVTVTEYSHLKALRNHADIVHYHWPDGDINRPGLGKSLERMLLLAAAVCLLKLKGTKIIWTAHNTAPHDARRPRLSRLFMQWFVRRCDGFIFMSEANKAAFFQHFQVSPKSQHAIIPHGHYRSCYPAAIDQAEAKQQLGLAPNKKVLLFIGMIKPYKNIDGLMHAFAKTELDDYQLVIAGTTHSAPPELGDTLHSLKNSNTHLFLRFIPDEELHIFMSAADVVILPYKAILNSGALLLALSYNRPVIAPHMGAVAELQKALGQEWIYSYHGSLAPANLTQALNSLETSVRPTQCPLDNYSWDKLARDTRHFYRQVCTEHQLEPAIVDTDKIH